jgi:predicted amidohydrolase YtcJ
MRKSFILLLIIIIGLSVVMVGSGTKYPVKEADFVLTNGKIYTVNESQPWAEAVAVKGNEIVYVGDNTGAKAFVGKETESIDLKGRLLLPGFIESHIHLAMGGATTSGVIMTMTDSVEDVLRKVEEYAEAHPDKKTIFGASYNGLLFDEKGPNKALLDEIIPDRPVYLMDHTLHSVWVNSRALEIAGITKDTEDPSGGQYIRDENGEPTGSIQGGPAHFPVQDAIQAITVESIGLSTPAVLEGMSEFGFTSAIDMGAPIATDAAFGALIALDKEGKLPLRLSLTHYINTAKLAETAVETLDSYAKKYKSDHIWVDTLKITIDSVLENQKAAMLEPYLSTGDRGSLYFDHDQMKQMVLGVAKKGYNVTVHAIGDRAVRETLDAAKELREAGYTDTLFSATHVQLVDPEDRPRFAELDVTVQTTSNWANHQPSYIEHIGQERNDTLQFPFRDLVDSGVNIALGADWPATPGGFEYGVNPFINIYTAMHRRVPADLIEEFGSADRTLPPPDQVLTLEEAVYGYTMGGAKMLGIDDEVGSIEVGKKADLIVLSQNLFEINPEDIPDTKVLGTMFDGKIIHDVIYELGDSELIDPDEVDRGSAIPSQGIDTHDYGY